MPPLPSPTGGASSSRPAAGGAVVWPAPLVASSSPPQPDATVATSRSSANGPPAGRPRLFRDLDLALVGDPGLRRLGGDCDEELTARVAPVGGDRPGRTCQPRGDLVADGVRPAPHRGDAPDHLAPVPGFQRAEPERVRLRDVRGRGAERPALTRGPR